MKKEKIAEKSKEYIEARELAVELRMIPKSMGMTIVDIMNFRREWDEVTKRINQNRKW